MKHIVSLSGGKDSTAMLLMMIEKDMRIDEIVFCDTGIEFPQMYNHLRKLTAYIRRPITILKQDKSFEEYLLNHKRKNGKIGYGFPYFRNRWCTTIFKRDPMIKHCRGQMEYHGIAYDEKERINNNQDRGRTIKYPLVDWKITEQECLNYCYSKGFDWEGLYKLTDRVGCWACPLCKVGHMKMLYNHFPELWNKLKEWDKKAWNNFKYKKTLEYYEKKFQNDNIQTTN